VIWDSNPDCRINSDADVCRISPKILWIHDLASASNFAEFYKNLVVRNANKSPKIPYSATVRKMEN